MLIRNFFYNPSIKHVPDVRLFRLPSLAHSATTPPRHPTEIVPSPYFSPTISPLNTYAWIISSSFLFLSFLFSFRAMGTFRSLVVNSRTLRSVFRYLRGYLLPRTSRTHGRTSASAHQQSAAIAVHVYHVTTTFALLLYHDYVPLPTRERLFMRN